MIIYINNKKLDVNRLESVYVINQKMGDGSIKYKGKVLNIENNFTYYGINEGDKLDLGSLKGGGGSFFQWFLAIIILFVFLFYLFSGLITFMFDFGLQVVKIVLLNNITKKTPTYSLMSKVISIIFFIIIAYLVYISIYTFSNFVSLQIFYLKDGGHGMKSVCDVQHKASRVGFWTAIFYTIIYGLNRMAIIPEEIIDDLPDSIKWLRFFIGPFIKILTKIGLLIKDKIPILIPFIGSFVVGYQAVVKDLIPKIWTLANDSKNLGCKDQESLKNLITELNSIIHPDTKGATSQFIKKFSKNFGFIQYFKKGLTKLKYNYYQMTKNEIYKDDFETYKSWLNAADADKHIPLSFLFSDNVQNIDLSNLSENVICQLFGFAKFMGKTLDDLDPDSTDISDMIISGSTAGTVSFIPFIIVFIYYLF